MRIRTRQEVGMEFEQEPLREDARHALSPCLSPLWSCKNTFLPELRAKYFDRHPHFPMLPKPMFELSVAGVVVLFMLQTTGHVFLI
jgi:hypothetical protein